MKFYLLIKMGVFIVINGYFVNLFEMSIIVN